MQNDYLTNKEFTLYTNLDFEMPRNTTYGVQKNIRDADDLYSAARYDHVGQWHGEHRKWKNGQGSNAITLGRAEATFYDSDVVIMDLDNTHTEDPAKWITEEDLFEAFRGCYMYVVTSRNHMKRKDGKEPRPKFHVYFPIERTYNVEFYKELKRKICGYYPFFDENAIDAARFFFANRDGLKVYEPKKLCYTTVDRFIETKLFSAQGQITLRPTEDGGFILEE